MRLPQHDHLSQATCNLAEIPHPAGWTNPSWLETPQRTLVEDFNEWLAIVFAQNAKKPGPGLQCCFFLRPWVQNDLKDWKTLKKMKRYRFALFIKNIVDTCQPWHCQPHAELLNQYMFWLRVKFGKQNPHHSKYVCNHLKWIYYVCLCKICVRKLFSAMVVSSYFGRPAA